MEIRGLPLGLPSRLHMENHFQGDQPQISIAAIQIPQKVSIHPIKSP